MTPENFLRKIKTSEGCSEWPGSIDSEGYGLVTIEGKLTRAHRLSYLLTIGDIPDRLFVLHTCDNPPCIKPEHLFLGTQKTNCIDMARKGRARSAKLTKEDVIDILKSYYNIGESLSSLMRRYKVVYTTIWKIIEGHHYPYFLLEIKNELTNTQRLARVLSTIHSEV